MLGSTALGLYAVAMVGVGVAVGGLWRTSLAAEVAALVVVATYLIDLLAPPLKLPDWVHQLALTAHLGQPMIGVWDPVGVVVCLVLGRRRRPARCVGHVPARPLRLSRAPAAALEPSGGPTHPGRAERRAYDADMDLRHLATERWSASTVLFTVASLIAVSGLVAILEGPDRRPERVVRLSPRRARLRDGVRDRGGHPGRVRRVPAVRLPVRRAGPHVRRHGAG